MKRLVIALMCFFAMLQETHAEHFSVTYYDDSPVPVEYQLAFETSFFYLDAVGVYFNHSWPDLEVNNTHDITNLRLPETVTYNGKTYRVTEIFGLSNSTSDVLGTLYIPKSIREIRGDVELSVESIVVEDAEIGFACGPICCEKLKTIDFGKAARHIGDFSHCSALESVTIPASVEDIDEKAFRGIPSLKTVKLASTTQKIGFRAFADCENLTTVETEMTEDCIVYFENSVFANCTALKHVTLPSVVSVSTEMFGGCSSLEYVKLGDRSFQGNPFDYGYYGEIGGINENAFKNCSNLVKIDMPATYRYIKDFAFAGCI